MSRRDNLSRIYVGNLPPDVRTKDLEDLFYKFGKIAFIDLKTRRGPPFAFVEFVDYRDAEDAVRSRDGKDWDGYRLRVEFPRGRERTSNFNRNGSKSSRGGPPQRRSKYRVSVSGNYYFLFHSILKTITSTIVQQLTLFIIKTQHINNLSILLYILISTRITPKRQLAGFEGSHARSWRGLFCRCLQRRRWRCRIPQI